MADDDFEINPALSAALSLADKPTASNSEPLEQTASAPSSNTSGRVVQPTPNKLPARSGPNAILVSPRQKGNPIINSIRSVPWEYADIIPDYVLGTTTCALFLSLKYHRLHPEYIYNRIQKLAGKYNLRILLVMVDIQTHEEPLKELSKTSLINNVTIILAWSAQEAGRYLELFKTYEFAAPTSIRAQTSAAYSDRMVDFITVPRSINKTDALGLVSNFGSVRTAVNAAPEEVSMIAGWGEKKVQRWCGAVREPFRVKRAAKKTLGREDSRPDLPRELPQAEAGHGQMGDPRVNARLGIGPALVDESLPRPGTTVGDADRRPDTRIAEDVWQPNADEEEALMELEGVPAPEKPSEDTRSQKRKKDEEGLSEGVMAALAKLRK
jgi:DNA excision repair protein ERCC-1